MVTIFFSIISFYYHNLYISVVVFLFSFLLLFFFDIYILFYFIFKLYIIVLVLPNIKMNPPQVYTYCFSFFNINLFILMEANYYCTFRKICEYMCTYMETRPFQVALVVKNLPANAGGIRETGSIPGSGRSPGGGNESHSSILALRIP